MTQWPQRSRPSPLSGMTCLLVGLLAVGCGPSPGPELTWMRELLPGESSLAESAAWSTLQKTMHTLRDDHTATLLPGGKVLIVGGSNATARSLSSAELFDLNTGTWEETGSLHHPRAAHTATLLLDGKVLVAGGRDGAGNALDTSEVYNPVTGSWTLSEQHLNFARYDHAATLLLSGKVLVTGGFADAGAKIRLTETELYDPQLYDPQLGTWGRGDPLNHARSRHTATRLQSGKVLVAGGTGSELTLQAEESSIEGTSWSHVGALSQDRSEHTATLLPDGQVLIAGGTGTGLSGLGSTELYDPSSKKWRVSAGPMVQPRLGHTAVLLFTGQVLVMGGIVSPSTPSGISSTEVYDPNEQTWTRGAALKSGRFKHTATLLPTGQVLVAGGFENSAPQSAEVEVYDPSPGHWHDERPLRGARSGHTVTLLPNGKLLFVGGTPDGTTALARTELYDPASGEWSSTATPLNTARFHHTATLLPNGKLLVAGGTSDGATALPSAELYDPDTDQWSKTVTPLNTARFHHTATLLPNGQVLIAGGTPRAGTALDTAELYDPATGQWSKTASLNSARSFHTATRLPGGQVLLLGGTADEATALEAAELYDPESGSWTAMGNTQPQFEHTATLLPSGQILVAGGRNGSIPQSTVRLYECDLEKKELRESARASLSTSRYAHTATLLPSGRVLIAGGKDLVNALSSAEVYDPMLGRWSFAPSPLSTARHHAAATLLPSGQVLISGGVGNESRMDSLQVYADPLAAIAEASRPQFQPLSLQRPQDQVQLTGSHLLQLSETGGGNARSSASALPLVSLIAVDGGALTRVTQWATSSDRSLTFQLPTPQTGHYILCSMAQGACSGDVFLMDGTPPAAPQVTQPLQNQIVFATRRPPLKGTAEPGSKVTLKLDGTDVGPVSIDGQGNWRYTPSAPLEVGTHTFQVTATDKAENEGDPSSVTFHIDLPVSHYGWGCSSTSGISLSGLWLVASLWLRRRSRRRSACPLGH